MRDAVSQALHVVWRQRGRDDERLHGRFAHQRRLIIEQQIVRLFCVPHDGEQNLCMRLQRGGVRQHMRGEPAIFGGGPDIKALGVEPGLDQRTAHAKAHAAAPGDGDAGHERA